MAVNCCVCDNLVDSEDAQQLSQVIQEPVCSQCAKMLNDMRFSSDKNDARAYFQEIADVNDQMDSGVREYLESSVGIKHSAAVPQKLMTTGFDFVGYRIVRYLGVVSGDYVVGAGFGSVSSAGLNEMVGTESDILSDKVKEAKGKSRSALARNAAERGANAVIGVDFDMFTMKGLFGVSANGTAVVVEKVAAD